VSASYFAAAERAAAERPDETAFDLRSAGRRISWSELVRGIVGAAAVLDGRGVGPGDVVPIFAQHSPGMLFAFFGAQRLGAIPAFFSPPTPRQPADAWRADHARLIGRLRPRLVVCEEAALSAVAGFSDVAPLGATDLETTALATSSSGRPPLAEPDDVALLQHSSGTTGLKKGVKVTYRQLSNQVDAYSRSIGLKSGDSVVTWLPVYHDMGLIAATLMPFSLGLPVFALDPLRWLERPSNYLALLAEQPNSVSWLPNFAFAYLAERGQLAAGADLSHVKAIINCSEPCKPEAMKAFQTRFATQGLPRTAVQVCYAMAEYVFAVTQTPPGAEPRVLTVDADAFDAAGLVQPAPEGRTFVSCGPAIEGVELSVAGGNPGVVGEIQVRGPALCAGYFENPQATSEKFAQGWYHTGDLGFVHEGELYVTGRKDDLIIVRGKNIYAHDVEALVGASGHAKPGRVVAFGIHEPALGTEALIVIAETEQRACGEAGAQAVTQALLSAYGLSPAEVRFVAPNVLVKTSSGKISREANRARYLAGELEAWRPAAEAIDER
jgi:fatty-acyl-CoA synthase